MSASGLRIACIFDTQLHETIIERINRPPLTKRMNTLALFQDVEIYLSLGVRDDFYEIKYEQSAIPENRRYLFQRRTSSKNEPKLHDALSSVFWGARSNFIANLLSEVINKKKTEPELFDMLRSQIVNKNSMVDNSDESALDIVNKELDHQKEGMLVEEVSEDVYQNEVNRSEREAHIQSGVDDTFAAFDI